MGRQLSWRGETLSVRCRLDPRRLLFVARTDVRRGGDLLGSVGRFGFHDRLRTSFLDADGSVHDLALDVRTGLLSPRARHRLVIDGEVVSEGPIRIERLWIGALIWLLVGFAVGFLVGF